MKTAVTAICKEKYTWVTVFYAPSRQCYMQPLIEPLGANTGYVLYLYNYLNMGIIRGELVGSDTNPGFSLVFKISTISLSSSISSLSSAFSSLSLWFVFTRFEDVASLAFDNAWVFLCDAAASCCLVRDKWASNVRTFSLFCLGWYKPGELMVINYIPRFRF